MSNVSLSRMLDRIPASSTISRAEALATLVAADPEFINLGGGAIMLPVHERIREAGARFWTPSDGDLKLPYPDARGQREARMAFAQMMLQRRALELDADAQVRLMPAGKIGILYFLIAVRQAWGPEDGRRPALVLLKPYFRSFAALARLLGFDVIEIDCTADGSPDMQDLEAKVDPGTPVAAIIFNTQRNPDGRQHTAQELRNVHGYITGLVGDVMVLADEVYWRVRYPDAPDTVSAWDVLPQDWTFVLDSTSKASALASIRVGVGWGSHQICEAIGRLSSQTTTGVAIPMARVAAASFGDAGTEWTVGMMDRLMSVRGDWFDWASDHPAFRTSRPTHTPYLCVLPQGFAGKTLRGVAITDDVRTFCTAAEKFGLGFMPDWGMARANLAQQPRERQDTARARLDQMAREAGLL